MKAAVLYRTGSPLTIEDDIEIPQLEPGQVLVKIFYSGVCHSQLMEARGHRGSDKFLPHLLGHEGSGVVIDVGKEITKVKKGDEVVLTWIKGMGKDCAGPTYTKDGKIIHAGPITTFNQFAVISENRCVKLPDRVPMDIASLFGCAVLTGAGIVLNEICPERHNSIAIFGIGGIGLNSVMAANLCQCQTIIAVDLGKEKLSIARQSGATHVIDAAENDPVKSIMDITGGFGVDYSVEATGKTEVIEKAFSSVKKRGGLCVFAGHPPQGKMIRIDPFELISGKRIRGSWGGGSKPDYDIPKFCNYYLEGKLPLEMMTGDRYSLEDVNNALDDLENRRITRAIIEIDPC